jgi:hypothetical protein
MKTRIISIFALSIFIVVSLILVFVRLEYVANVEFIYEYIVEPTSRNVDDKELMDRRIDNSIHKFLKSNSSDVRFTTSIKAIDRQRQFYRLSVKAESRGLAVDMVQRVFDAYQKSLESRRDLVLSKNLANVKMSLFKSGKQLSKSDELDVERRINESCLKITQIGGVRTVLVYKFGN